MKFFLCMLFRVVWSFCIILLGVLWLSVRYSWLLLKCSIVFRLVMFFCLVRQCLVGLLLVQRLIWFLISFCVFFWLCSVRLVLKLFLLRNLVMVLFLQVLIWYFFVLFRLFRVIGLLFLVSSIQLFGLIGLIYLNLFLCLVRWVVMNILQLGFFSVSLQMWFQGKCRVRLYLMLVCLNILWMIFMVMLLMLFFWVKFLLLIVMLYGGKFFVSRIILQLGLVLVCVLLISSRVVSSVKSRFFCIVVILLGVWSEVE